MNSFITIKENSVEIDANDVIILTKKPKHYILKDAPMSFEFNLKQDPDSFKQLPPEKYEAVLKYIKNEPQGKEIGVSIFLLIMLIISSVMMCIDKYYTISVFMFLVAILQGNLIYRRFFTLR